MADTILDVGMRRAQFHPAQKHLVIRVIEAMDQDPRLARFLELIRRTEFRPVRNLELSVADKVNIYLSGFVSGDYREQASQYFADEDVIADSVRQEKAASHLSRVFYGSSDSSVSVDFLKTSGDGTMQFAAFGSDWESHPGNPLAVYGYVVSERKMSK